MEDEISNTMNLDLNLGPGPESDDPVNLDEWMEVEGHVRFRDAVRRTSRLREAVRRSRQRWRWRQVELEPLSENQDGTMSLGQFLATVRNQSGSTTQEGEGSAPAEDRPREVEKMCENKTVIVEDEVMEKKDNDENVVVDESSFFECNICYELAREPVVTCCGHLFCWPCIYRWLHVHSDTKECPVCKGEVTTKNVTPVYGRGNVTRVVEEDSNLKIPPRPNARRVESLRQILPRSAFAFPMEEMIRRLGTRFDLSRDLATSQDPDGAGLPTERSNSFLNRFMTSRGVRREQTAFVPPDNVLDLTQSRAASPEVADGRRLPSLLLRRSSTQRAATSLTSLSSALNSAERLVEAYFHSHPIARHQEQPGPVDDRDSSSVAAVIHSESQTMDTAVEIDSMVSLSTSSSRRRYDVSRISDVDSGDSRAPRRRRLNQ